MFESAHFFYAGKFVSQKKWIHPEISIPQTELIIVDRGPVMIEEDGVRYSVSDGCVLFLSPETIHRGYEVSKKPVSFWWIHINGLDMNNSNLSKHFKLSDFDSIVNLCYLLLHYSGKAAGKEVTDRILYLLLFELSEQYMASNQTEKKNLQCVCDWIRTNASRNLTVKEVASEFNYNEDYLSGLCKKHYGIGLNAIIINTRIAFLKRLLMDSNLSLQEISSEAGFDSYTQFRQYFKYHVGIPPKKFQKIHYAIFINDK